MSERRAFDLARYRRDASFNLTAFTHDLATLSLEAAAAQAPAQRITPFTLEQTPQGKVINRPLGSRDVREYFSQDSDLDRKETRAGLAFRDALLTEPVGTLAIWISPPGGPLDYKEGRVVVGVSKFRDNMKILEAYGFPIFFNRDDCLLIAWRLAEFSQYEYALANVETLRENVLIITNPGANPWNLLRDIIPAEEIWASIESGKAQREMEKVLSEAQKATQQVLAQILTARSHLDLIRVGAQVEMLMEATRGALSPSCGTLNKDLLAYTQINVRLSNDGSVISAIKDSGKYIKKCPYCQTAIERVIEPGFHCSCGQVYEGVC